MIRICTAAAAAVLLGLFVSGIRPEFGRLLSLAAVALVLSLVLGTVREVFSLLTDLCESVGMEDVYVRALFKILGIAYAAELTAGISRDAGYHTLGQQVELAGKFMICAVSLPALLALLELMEELLGAGI